VGRRRIAHLASDRTQPTRQPGSSLRQMVMASRHRDHPDRAAGSSQWQTGVSPIYPCGPTGPRERIYVPAGPTAGESFVATTRSPARASSSPRAGRQRESRSRAVPIAGTRHARRAGAQPSRLRRHIRGIYQSPDGPARMTSLRASSIICSIWRSRSSVMSRTSIPLCSPVRR
jgi:hypothetical protein